MTIKHFQLNYTIDWQEERRSLNKLVIKGNKFKLKNDKFLHTIIIVNVRQDGV